MQAPRRKGQMRDDDLPEVVPAPAATQPSLPIPDVPTAQRRNAKTRKTYTVTARPHVSLYVSEAVQRAVKVEAAQRDMKPHDLYVEGLRRVLAEMGHDFDALNAQKPDGATG